MHTHRCCSKIQIVTRSKFFPFSLEYTVPNRGAYSRQSMFCSKATLSAFAASDWPAAASSSSPAAGTFFFRTERTLMGISPGGGGGGGGWDFFFRPEYFFFSTSRSKHTTMYMKIVLWVVGAAHSPRSHRS